MSCARSLRATSNASPCSTTIRSSIPSSATSLPGASTIFLLNRRPGARRPSRRPPACSRPRRSARLSSEVQLPRSSQPQSSGKVTTFFAPSPSRRSRSRSPSCFGYAACDVAAACSHACELGHELVERASESRHARQSEHPAVPKITVRVHELLGALEVRASRRMRPLSNMRTGRDFRPP